MVRHNRASHLVNLCKDLDAEGVSVGRWGGVGAVSSKVSADHLLQADKHKENVNCSQSPVSQQVSSVERRTLVSQQLSEHLHEAAAGGSHRLEVNMESTQTDLCRPYWLHVGCSVGPGQQGKVKTAATSSEAWNHACNGLPFSLAQNRAFKSPRALEDLQEMKLKQRKANSFGIDP